MQDNAQTYGAAKQAKFRQGMRTDMRMALAILADLQRDMSDLRKQLAAGQPRERPKDQEKNNALDR